MESLTLLVNDVKMRWGGLLLCHVLKGETLRGA